MGTEAYALAILPSDCMVGKIIIAMVAFGLGLLTGGIFWGNLVARFLFYRHAHAEKKAKEKKQ